MINNARFDAYSRTLVDRTRIFFDDTFSPGRNIIKIRFYFYRIYSLDDREGPFEIRPVARAKRFRCCTRRIGTGPGSNAGELIISYFTSSVQKITLPRREATAAAVDNNKYRAQYCVVVRRTNRVYAARCARIKMILSADFFRTVCDLSL